ncbi:glycosyltransferase 87 family protein [Streptomyces sp. NBC_00096]|uniref:glycosyltransferase 87 family protein n=1 Tax=Streptomyces sp. NBC_00096 TaxID=2975650 RepID=UPI0032477A13
MSGKSVDDRRGASEHRSAPTTGTRWLGAVGLSVVIPGPVPEATLTAVRHHLDAHSGTGPGDWELIVVTAADEDGPAREPLAAAADETAAAADEPRIRLVRPASGHRGKGAALRAGVLASAGRRVLLADAALTTPLDELARLEDALDADAPDEDARRDERRAPGRAPGRAPAQAAGQSNGTPEAQPPAVVQGRSGNRLVRALGIPGIPGFRADTCGFALFDGDRARAAFAASTLDGPAIDAEVLRWIRRQGWEVAEIPVSRAAQKVPAKLPAYKVPAQRVPAQRVPAPKAPAPKAPEPRTDRRQALAELLRLNAGGLAVAAAFLALSFYIFHGLWADLGGSYLADALQDQNQWEWFVGVTTDNITHLRNPFFTFSQGMPDGVNLMANATMLGLNVPLIPVTLLFGETVTFALVLTLGMAASAWTWYWLIRRHFVRSRWAAAAGGALAAFAPPMVSHANGHPNFVVLFMIPLIIDRALRLCGPHRRDHSVTRDGVLLGLFATYQIFIGEEPLLIAALGMLVFCLACLLVDHRRALAAARPLGAGLAVALAVCLPLLIVPLHWQFSGPQSYHSVLHGDDAGNSPRALIEYASRSLFGDPETAGRLSLNTTEQNAFYGWPLLAFAVAVCVWLWRDRLVRALAVTGFVALLLSLGPWVPVPHTEVVLPGPWRLIIKLPLFESVIEGRVAMVCAPVLGILLALALDRIVRLRTRELRTLGLLGAAAALIPVLPLPLTVRDRAPVPAFITSGSWKDYVKDGEALVPVPLPDPGQADALHWQVEADFGFRLAGGYFNGPWGPDRMGIYGATPRNLSNLLRDVRYGAQPPEITPAWQVQARQDLEYWKAGAVVLPVQDRDTELRQLITGLLGRPPEKVLDAWVWRVGPGQP